MIVLECSIDSQNWRIHVLKISSSVFILALNYSVSESNSHLLKKLVCIF